MGLVSWGIERPFRGHLHKKWNYHSHLQTETHTCAYSITQTQEQNKYPAHAGAQPIRLSLSEGPDLAFSPNLGVLQYNRAHERKLRAYFPRSTALAQEGSGKGASLGALSTAHRFQWFQIGKKTIKVRIRVSLLALVPLPLSQTPLFVLGKIYSFNFF